MSSELRRQAEQLYKDLEPDVNANPLGMASDITVTIFNTIRKSAQEKYPDNETINALPIATEGTNISAIQTSPTYERWLDN